MLPLLAVFGLLGVASGQATEQVTFTDQPGAQFEIRFKQVSGYLNASATVRLHYW